jgi:uncharacterized protein with HEPN domain
MTHDPRQSLFDIEQAASKIIRYAAGKTLADYLSDDYFRSAVERQFEIIGEAVNRIKKIDPALVTRLSEYEKIIGFRNQLIHGYDIIDDEISWAAVERKLPVLLKETKMLRTELDRCDS